MSEKKIINKYMKSKKITTVFSGVLSIINILLMLQTIAVLWGIPITPTRIVITRELLLQYEIYIRYAITLLFFVFMIDMFVYDYYKKKYATLPPKSYGVFVSFLVMFISCLGYYVYQLPVFLYFAMFGAFSLTYYLTLFNPYEHELASSKIIKSKQ